VGGSRDIPLKRSDCEILRSNMRSYVPGRVGEETGVGRGGGLDKTSRRFQREREGGVPVVAGSGAAEPAKVGGWRLSQKQSVKFKKDGENVREAKGTLSMQFGGAGKANQGKRRRVPERERGSRRSGLEEKERGGKILAKTREAQIRGEMG